MRQTEFDLHARVRPVYVRFSRFLFAEDNAGCRAAKISTQNIAQYRVRKDECGLVTGAPELVGAFAFAGAEYSLKVPRLPVSASSKPDMRLIRTKRKHLLTQNL